MTVPDVLRRKAAKLGDRPALVVDRGEGPSVAKGDEHGAMTFAEWDRASDRLAAAIVDAGVRPGDRVGIAFENRDADRFCVSYFAALKAGGVAVPIGARWVEAEVDNILAHAEPSVVVADAARAASMAASHRRILGPEDYDRAIARAVEHAPRVERREEDLCDILYTSGTTGAPKGVTSTHGNVVKLAYAAFKAFEGRAFLHAIPMWTFAGAHAMQFMPLRAGMRAVVMHRFDARRYLALVAAHEAAATYAVPAMLKLALDASAATPASDRADTSPLVLLMFGSAPTPPAVLARLGEIAPRATFINLYGQTETGSAGCAMMIQPGEMTARPGSIGRPLGSTEVRIVVEEDGADARDARAGETGEIWMRGDGEARSYYRDAEATARTFLPGGWVRTGDLGHLDDEGYLYLDDRKKELVIRGGLNVFPAEIDALLEAHPAVKEAAVVGVPHEVLGEDLCAYVALRAGAEASADDLRAHLAKRIADYKVPRRIVFVESLPRSAMGKVLKRALRERETRG